MASITLYYRLATSKCYYNLFEGFLCCPLARAKYLICFHSWSQHDKTFFETLQHPRTQLIAYTSKKPFLTHVPGCQPSRLSWGHEADITSLCLLGWHRARPGCQSSRSVDRGQRLDSLAPVRQPLTEPSERRTMHTGHLHRVWARSCLLSHYAVHGVEQLAEHFLPWMVWGSTYQSVWHDRQLLCWGGEWRIF